MWPNTVGTTGKLVRSNGTSNAYSTSTFADTYTASNLLYSNGANTVTGLATANNGVLSTDGSGVPSISSTLPSGLTIPGYSTFAYSNVTGAAQTMAVNTGYVANNSGSAVAFTLPTTAAVGTIMEIAGSCSGGWNIVQNANQIVHVGSLATTTGVGGSITTTNRYDGIRMICIVANLEWSVLGMQGNLTVV